MEKELLQKALDSILHGSTRVISETDQYGNTVSREIRVNDLRVDIVNKLVEQLAKTDGFKQALEKAFTQEVLNKMVDQMMSTLTWDKLPYELQNRLRDKMKVEDVRFQKFKMVIEAVENN
jgi:hypothetical protein